MTRLIDADDFFRTFPELAIEPYINAPTIEFPFVHVKFKHPRFGECDGWLDKQRQLLFFDFITTELAQKYNWTWKEADNDKV